VTWDARETDEAVSLYLEDYDVQGDEMERCPGLFDALGDALEESATVRDAAHVLAALVFKATQAWSDRSAGKIARSYEMTHALDALRTAMASAGDPAPLLAELARVLGILRRRLTRSDAFWDQRDNELLRSVIAEVKGGA